MNQVKFTFRPLDHSTWPSDGRYEYKASRFQSPWSNTMRLLTNELRRIDVTEAVIELDVTEDEIRLDGLPRADARPDSPRVRISFKHPGVGPLQYPCDTYSNWQDNVRAIAVTLEAQRAMERHGATRRHQQYTGWKSLPPGGGTPMPTSATMSITEAARFLASVSGWADASEIDNEVNYIMENHEHYRDAYRHAASKLHPDTGGSDEAFIQLQRVKKMLDAMFQEVAP